MMMMMTITKIFIDNDYVKDDHDDDEDDDDDIHILFSIYERYRYGSNIKMLTNDSTPKGKLTNYLFLNKIIKIIRNGLVGQRSVCGYLL
jgi:hypothetical protein